MTNSESRPRPGGGVPPNPGGAAPAVVIVAAVERELAPLHARLDSARAGSIGRKPAVFGRLGGDRVVLLAAGLGKTNAAQAMTALLESRPVRGVVNVGVAGAYPASGLEVGAVALATEEIYGDEGVDTPDGWLSTEAIGIPLLHNATRTCFNRVELDVELVERAAARLAAVGMVAATGPFVTVSCCSGTGRRGDELGTRFAALCESMEGAAFAHVAALYEVPFLELRGVSNRVEDRDLSRWRIDEAATAACDAAASLPGLFGPGPAG